jgi:uncharacterized protein YdgA (DUF945 family)
VVTFAIGISVGIIVTLVVLVIGTAWYLAEHPITLMQAQRIAALVNFEVNIIGALRKRNALQRGWDKVQLGLLILQIIVGD